MPEYIRVHRDFPLGELVAGMSIERRLRGGPARGQYLAEGDGRPLLATIALEQRSPRDAVLRELEHRVGPVAPVRGIYRLTDATGAAYDVLVEELPAGEVIGDLVWPLALVHAVRIGIQLADAAAASSRPLIGIRPELVFYLREGDEMHLAGIAPRGERFVATATRPSSGVGPLFDELFVAPEVIAGQTPSAAADVFSIAMLLARLTSCEYPFAGADPARQLQAILRGDRHPFAGPPELAPILDRALLPEAERRPGLTELVAELAALLRPQ